jgi:PhzF family phenazine biosynthesis protein
MTNYEADPAQRLGDSCARNEGGKAQQETRMKLPLFQIDAFTDRLFHGNPAAVVILNEWLSGDTLQTIAAENNLSETAFVIPRSDGAPLRWFTPTVEVDLCGHATLAAAHVLFQHYFPSLETIEFSTKGGRLTVRRDGGLLRMDFPARPAIPVEITDSLISALHVKPREVWLAEKLMAVLDSEAEVRDFQPDLEGIAALDSDGLIITAAGDTVDFVSRYFAPNKGIPEDPVTGSAHCVLVPYWATRLGKNRLVARQVSSRGGDLFCDMRGDRVNIAGNAVDYLRGEITL